MLLIQTIFGNLTATISDNLPQFSIIPDMFGSISGNKSNIYEWDWCKLLTCTFNNYFASVAETTKKTKYSHEYFSNYLSNENSSTIFLQPTDKEEIASIISSLNSNKASGPNSIGTL